MKKTILLFFAFLMALSMQAQSVDGSWTGKLCVGGTQLTIVLNITKASTESLRVLSTALTKGLKAYPLI